MTSKPSNGSAVRPDPGITDLDDRRSEDTRPGRRVPASVIYDLVPIGSVIRFRDGTPRPPCDRAEDLKVWALFNGSGRLAMKEPPPHGSPLPHPVSITLRTSEFGAGSTVGLTISLAEPHNRELKFEVVELPPMGSVRILRRFTDNFELLHLAADHHAAVRWLAQHPVPVAIFDPVTADEIAAAVVEGRCLTP